MTDILRYNENDKQYFWNIYLLFKSKELIDFIRLGFQSAYIQIVQ